MKKVLVLASVASMIEQFNMNNIKLLQELGYEVHVAANFKYGSTSSVERVEELKKELEKINIPYYHIEFSRKVTDIFSNIEAYKKIKSLMHKNKYEFVHCHSPIGGACGRFAAHKTNTKTIYTAHGFHFFKGCPKKNWVLYFPIEKFLARYTDILITINREDYNRAKRLFKAKKIEYIPGVGIDVNKFSESVVDKSIKRKSLNIPQDAFLLISVGELNNNKNHETIIKALAKLNNPNVYYVICGKGLLDDYLKKLAKELCLEKQVKLLGYCRNIEGIIGVANAFVFPSKREGLGLAALEAMASGLPLITSNIHGIIDYSIDGQTGFTCNYDDVNGFANAIDKLANNVELSGKVGEYNRDAVKIFDVSNVNKKMREIYLSDCLDNQYVDSKINNNTIYEKE